MDGLWRGEYKHNCDVEKKKRVGGQWNRYLRETEKRNKVGDYEAATL